MSEESSEYKYQGLDKDERRRVVSTSGELDRKRFALSTNPEISGRLKTLRQVFERFKAVHPQVVSLGLYGSYTKGYASKESDFDMRKEQKNRQVAKMKGYEGDPCPECGSYTLLRNGTCLKCDTCGSTTGCS